jgi:hypothetical protein
LPSRCVFGPRGTTLLPDSSDNLRDEPTLGTVPDEKEVVLQASNLAVPVTTGGRTVPQAAGGESPLRPGLSRVRLDRQLAGRFVRAAPAVPQLILRRLRRRRLCGGP